MLNHVLIALDGSPLAERAIEPAKSILRPQGKITLVHAVHDSEVYEKHTHPVAQATSYLERVAVNLRLNGYEVDTEIRTGEPAVVITEIARLSGAAVIVMCTHGRSGLSRFLFGSVTTDVLNTTPCPVLVIPNRERERSSEIVREENTAPDMNLRTTG